MATLAPLFLIESTSFLYVTRTTITSRMSSTFSKYDHGQRAELAALEGLKNPDRLIMAEMLWPL